MEKSIRSKQSGISGMVVGLVVGAGLTVLAVAAAIAFGLFNTTLRPPSGNGENQAASAGASSTAGRGSLTSQPNMSEDAESESGEQQITPSQYLTPLVSLSANWGGEVEVYRGWPIVLNARLLNPALMLTEDNLTPMVLDLEEEGAPWTQAARIEVTNDKGEMQAWSVVLATEPQDSLSLDGETAGDMIWSISPEETADLDEGRYEIVAVLDTAATGADGSWKGEVRSPAATVTIGSEPEALSAEQETEKYLLLASYEMVQDDQDAAWERIDTLLDRQPENLGALSFKGDLLAIAGKDSEALATYNYAIDLFYADNPDAEEPPINLLRKQGDMLNKLLVEVDEE